MCVCLLAILDLCYFHLKTLGTVAAARGVVPKKKTKNNKLFNYKNMKKCVAIVGFAPIPIRFCSNFYGL